MVGPITSVDGSDVAGWGTTDEAGGNGNDNGSGDGDGFEGGARAGRGEGGDNCYKYVHRP